MRVVVYPADRFGCGHHRLIWPAEELARQGHDVVVVPAKERHLRLQIDNQTGHVASVELPEGTDVVVLQRVTHRYLAEVVPIIRSQGVAVVVDVDDDLAAIHPSNPAWTDLHPKRSDILKLAESPRPHMHSWHNLAEACKHATLVTTTTPALARRYAVHGRGVVVPNYLAEHYYKIPRVDDDLIGWPASLHSHPNDPEVVGNAIQRLVNEGATFRVVSNSPGVGSLFGLLNDGRLELITRQIELMDWPHEIAKLGIGIAPLADTRFNAAKSWLKPLELCAVGVPWVASNRVEYRRLHKLGCGILVDKPKEWYATLRNLRRDRGRRVELSEAGRTVAHQLRLTTNAWRWWEAWDEAHKIQTDARSADVLVAN